MSAPVAWIGVDLAADALVEVDVRSEANRRLFAALKARLEAGEPVALPADPFRPYRGPTASEPVTLFLPARPARRS